MSEQPGNSGPVAYTPQMLIEWLRMLSVLVAGAVFWLAYIDLKDRARPEPRIRILMSFLLGMGAAAVALAAFRFLRTHGFALDPADDLVSQGLFCLLGPGAIEEGVKFLAFFLFVRRWSECDEPVDGFVYAGTIGCGFATLENFFYLPSATVVEQLARGAVLPITHALFSSIWGLALMRQGRRWWRVPLALVGAMVLHGLYDFLALSLNFPKAGSAIILCVWVAVLFRVRSITPPVAQTGRGRSFSGLLLTGAVLVVCLMLYVGLQPKSAATPRIWFADGGVLGPLRGDVRLQVHVADGGTGVSDVRVSVDGRRLRRDGGAWIWPSADTEDGSHVMRVEALGRGLETRRAVRFGRLFSDNTPAVIQASRASKQPRQGGSFVLLLRPSEPVQDLEATWNDEPLVLYKLFPEEGPVLYRSMRGVWVKHPAGVETVVLRFRDLDGRERQQEMKIEIQKTDFSGGSGVINIARKKQSTTSRPRPGSDQARRNAAYAYPIPAQLWEGNHRRPTAGPRSSRFGKLRTYKAGVKRHHLGVDISNDEATPVYAANHGIVTLAEVQYAFGNVVIVGHGEGISTSYNHLMVPGVRRGTRLRKGDFVGLMGTTGLSTGPHLHWGMEVNGIAVDAEEWLDHSFDGVGVDDFE